MNDNLKSNFIYFEHLGIVIPLPIWPDNITDQQSPSFKETNALARSAPVFTYSNTGARTINISLDLHRDMFNDIAAYSYNSDVSIIDSNYNDVKKDVSDYETVELFVKYLLASALPKYSSSTKSINPPRVAMRLGNDIYIKGVINSAISVTYKKPILVGDKYACISVSFTISETDPYSAQEVSQVGSFRKIASGVI